MADIKDYDWIQDPINKESCTEKLTLWAKEKVCKAQTAQWRSNLVSSLWNSFDGPLHQSTHPSYAILLRNCFGSPLWKLAFLTLYKEQREVVPLCLTGLGKLSISVQMIKSDHREVFHQKEAYMYTDFMYKLTYTL